MVCVIAILAPKAAASPAIRGRHAATFQIVDNLPPDHPK
jgi:hypothetical protein